MKVLVFGILFFISSPAFAMEQKGMDLFNKALENVKQYHLEQTMTDPEDAITKALLEMEQNSGQTLE